MNDKIDGTKYDDDLRGGVKADTLNGFGGSDILIGNGGADDDTINVYVGSVDAYRGDGNNFFRTNGAGSIFVGSGVDTLDLSMLNGVDFTLAASRAGRIAAISTRHASIKDVLGNTADNFCAVATAQTS
ncbi:MAG: hypothetical protein H7245_15080 [Candidatus Saccharibacteria bacterium]|nr:hypothetical protein [Pseudorhodobacter sp.]